jgi:H+-translocating NAD(P) transhydrogenase subunit alpha
MRIAVAREYEVGERRVALVPDLVQRLVQHGHVVTVESGAGELAGFSNAAYETAGAKIVIDPAVLWGEAEILLKVAPPPPLDRDWPELGFLNPGTVLISLLNPLGNPRRMQELAQRQITTFGLEMIPRSSRAQSMDALSSQAAVAGYKAVLMAAATLPRFFPMLTTAAGTIPPAKVFVIGAGVAGLQAIATARRLGAVVEAFDIRPAVKEEVQSLGAKFVEVPLGEATVGNNGYALEVSEAAKLQTQETIARHVMTADVVITTAQVPGKKAPVLVTEAMVSQMKSGSVIVDLAAEQGGNCACTEPGRDVNWQGITVMGPINLPASVPLHASQMYAKNLLALIQHLTPKGQLDLNFADDIINSACLTHAGTLRHPQLQALVSELQLQSH